MSETVTDRTEYVERWVVSPVHSATDRARLADLAASMRGDGWQGRPLLVYVDHTGEYQALTGSHRLAAAKLAGLDEVPVVVLAADVCARAIELAADEYGGDLLDCIEDDGRERVLREAGDLVAADLMAAEIAANGGT